MLSTHLRILLLSSLLLAAGTEPLYAALPHKPPKDVKQQIADLEQQWRTATLNADIGLMDKLLSEDYVGISWTGQVNNKSSQLDRLRNHTLMITKMDLSDLKMKVVGSVAIVTSRADVTGTADGVELNDTFRYTRVYQHLPSGAWKITNLEATRVPRAGPHHGRGGAPPSPPPPAALLVPGSPGSSPADFGTTVVTCSAKSPSYVALRSSPERDARN
jgi:ketosteroid isomerase-like protein